VKQYKVTGDTAFFYSAPFEKYKMKSYLIRDDLISPTEKTNDYFFVMFTNSPTKRRTKGWIKISDVELIEWK
jgi:hypothetical protein